MASSSDYLTEAFNRLVAIEKEALTTYNADAVPYFFHAQEAFPYFTNRLDEDALTGDADGATEEWEVNRYTVRVRLVVAHLTEGVPGAPEAVLYTYVPLVTNYLRNRPLLQSAAYPAALDYLAPEGMSVQNATGLRIFTNAGFKVYQVGCEWSLRLPFTIPISEAF